MLIADLPVGNGSTLVATMGSCRLYEPFLAAVRADHVHLAHGVSSSFTYSAGETGQYFAFCSGRRSIPAFVWPYVFSDPRTTPPPPELMETLANAALCVAEISTLDQLTSGGVYFNWNELGQRFVRGKGPANALWWREVTDRRKRKASAEAVEQVLAVRRASGEDCSDEFAHFLNDMRFETLDETALRSHLEALTALGGQRWLFVSHFNVVENGPEVMADRRQLLEMLRRAAGALGHSVFDPTPTLAKFDWRRALPGNGADKHHYTAEFLPVLGEALMASIRDMLSASRTSTTGVAALRDEAKAAVAARRWEAAAVAWERLRDLEPSAIDGFASGAEALRSLGRLDDAEMLAVEAAERFPNSLWVMHIHAGIAASRGDWAEALRRWMDLRLRFPNDPGATANAANALIELGRMHEAVPLLRWLVDHHPDLPDGWVGLAKRATQEAQWEEATLAWQTIRERFSHLPIGWGFGVEPLVALGRLLDADALAGDGTVRFPSDLWLAHVRAGLAQRRDDLTDAVERWADVREHFPDDPIGYEHGGQILFEMGQVEAAREVFTHATLRFQARPNAFVSLAELNMRLGSWNAAALIWAEVRRRFPQRADGFRRGVEALRRAGLPHEADIVAKAGAELHGTAATPS